MGPSTSQREPAPAPGRRFETTQWTLVLEAGSGDEQAAREALEALCQSYWRPVYAYLRARGLDRDQAEDVTQGFFTRLIETRAVRHARRERGRFRSFLLASAKHYLANEWHRDRAQKRGGARALLRLDADDAERRLPAEPATRTTPEDLFVKQWALTVLDRAMESLESEMERRGQANDFAVLKGLLTGPEPGMPYREVAARLDTSEGAVKVRIHRTRQRFGQILRREIAELVAAPEAVDDELSALLDALSS